MRFLTPIILSLCLVLPLACTEAPSVPQLPPHSGTQDRIILDERLDTDDFRKLFQALNKNKKLNFFSPWLERTNNAQLEELVALVNEHLYQDALQPGGLVSLIEARLDQGDISYWSQPIASAAPKTLSLLKFATNSALLPEVVTDLSPLIQLGTPRNPSLPNLSTDIVSIISSPSLSRQFTKVVHQWKQPEMVAALLSFLSVNKNITPTTFTNVSNAVSKLLHNPPDGEKPEFAKLTRLISALNQPSDGIFIGFENYLDKVPQLVSQLSEMIAQMVPKTFASRLNGKLIEKLKSPASLNELASTSNQAVFSEPWLEVFAQIRSSLEDVLGPLKSPLTYRDANLHNAPIYLNSYALTKWIQYLFSENADSLKSPETLQSAKLLPAEQLIELTTDNTLTEAFLKEMKSGSLVKDETLQSFISWLGPMVEAGEMGEFAYDFYTETPLTFSQLLEYGALESNHTRPFSPSAADINAIILNLTSNNGTTVSISDLETAPGATVLDGLHQLVATFSYKNSSKILKMLVGWFDFDQTPDQSKAKDIILACFKSNPNHQKRVSDVLTNLSTFAELDELSDSGPSLFEVYHSMLTQVPPAKMNSVSSLLNLVESTYKLQTDQAAFPSLFSTLNNPSSMAKTLYEWAAVSSQTRLDLQRTMPLLFKSKLSKEELSAITWLRTIHNASPTEFVRLIDDLNDSAWDEFSFTELEREWLSQFIKSGSFEELWSLLGLPNSLDLIAGVDELLVLESEGELHKLVALLSMFQDERLKRMAQVGLKAIESGQLRDSLTALRAWLLAPTIEKPSTQISNLGVIQ